MSYAAWSVIAGEQPTAAKWSILGTNDASFNDGTGIANGAIINVHHADASIASAKLKYGLIRRRQGSTTGDASWQTAGTNNTDTSAKDVFLQFGNIPVPSDPTTITFPVAFTYPPIVLCAVASTNSNQTFVVQTSAPTTTAVTIHLLDAAGTIRTGENVSWVAVGQ